MEVTVLSEVWSLFEQLVKQAPPSQPLILLATCHAPLDTVPDSLLHFFAGQGSAAGLQQQGKLPSQLLVLERPSTQQWEACAGRAVVDVAASLAAAAGRELQQALLERQALAAAASSAQRRQQPAAHEMSCQNAATPACQGVPQELGLGASSPCNAADLEAALKLQRQVGTLQCSPSKIHLCCCAAGTCSGKTRNNILTFRRTSSHLVWHGRRLQLPSSGAGG